MDQYKVFHTTWALLLLLNIVYNFLGHRLGLPQVLLEELIRAIGRHSAGEQLQVCLVVLGLK